MESIKLLVIMVYAVFSILVVVQIMISGQRFLSGSSTTYTYNYKEWE